MKRDKIVPVRVNNEEDEKLKKIAASLGMTLAAYMRMAALNYKEVK